MRPWNRITSRGGCAPIVGLGLRETWAARLGGGVPDDYDLDERELLLKRCAYSLREFDDAWLAALAQALRECIEGQKNELAVVEIPNDPDAMLLNAGYMLFERSASST